MKNTLKKNDCIKFKHGKNWLYGFIDEIKENDAEVSYGSKKAYEKVMNGDRQMLEMFCDIPISEIIQLGINRFNTTL